MSLGDLTVCPGYWSMKVKQEVRARPGLSAWRRNFLTFQQTRNAVAVHLVQVLGKFSASQPNIFILDGRQLK